MKELNPIIVNAPQLSREWFEARLGNVTGSMVHTTMEYYAVTNAMLAKADEYFELNPHALDVEIRQRLREDYDFEYCLRAGIELVEKSTRKNYRRGVVSERLTGYSMSSDMYQTKAMQWGQGQEFYAKKAYSAKTGHKIENSPLFLHRELMTGASPDGLVIDCDTGELGNVECKSLEPWNHLYKIIMPEEVPAEHIPQIQHQMWINGRAWCDFIGFDPRVKIDMLTLFIKRVERDDFFIKEVLEPSVVRFLDECDREEKQFYAIQKKREKMASKSYWGIQSMSLELEAELEKAGEKMTPLDVEQLMLEEVK